MTWHGVEPWSMEGRVGQERPKKDLGSWQPRGRTPGKDVNVGLKFPIIRVFADERTVPPRDLCKTRGGACEASQKKQRVDVENSGGGAHTQSPGPCLSDNYPW